MSRNYSKTLEEARKVVKDFDMSRNGRESTRQDLIKSGIYNESHIRKLLSEADNRISRERRQAEKRIEKLREKAMIQLREQYSLFSGVRCPKELIDLFHVGYKLTELDYTELISRYSDNIAAMRLIAEHADADGFVIRGIESEKSERQALENHFSALSNFLLVDDGMRRRFLDINDVESQEKTITASLDLKKVEVTRKPKTLEEDWNQSLSYEEKLKQLDHDRDHPLEKQIIEAIFDRDSEKAEKLAKVENAMKKTEAEKRNAIIENMTPDMAADISWMRVFRNEDPDGEITDKEVAWLTSAEYRTMYETRAKEQGKESDYPSFLDKVTA